MDCPICFNPFKPPIYQCVGGHSFCSSCCKRLAKCPTCSRGMTRTRNYTLEAIVDELLMVPCPNANEGCLVRQHQEDIPQHLKVCEFRIYTCPTKFISVCDWHGRRRNLYQHVKEKHDWNTQKRFGMAWTATHPQYPMSFHYLHEKMFYFYRLLKNETLYWVIQYIGPVREASNYYYDVTISKKNSKQKLMLSQVCFADELTPDEIIEAGLCVGVPLEALKQYKVKSGKFLCSIEVNVY